MDVVEIKIKQLDEILKERGKITCDEAAEIVGVSRSQISIIRAERSTLVQWIKDMLPIYENWPDVEIVSELFGLQKSSIRKWYTNPATRDITGAKKIAKSVRFSPRWFAQYDTGATYIQEEEAGRILNLDDIKLRLWRNKLGGVQPAGNAGRIMYDKAKVENIKKKLEEVKGMVTASAAAKEIDLPVHILVKKIRHSRKHPITGERLYASDRYQKYSTCAAAECSSVEQAFNVFENKHRENLEKLEGIRRLITNFVCEGRIGSRKMKGIRVRYLTPDGEIQVRNIYKNLADLGLQNLLSIEDAARKSGLSTEQLRNVIKAFGLEQILSKQMEAPVLEIGYKGIDKVKPWVPVIPYFRYFPKTLKYLHKETISELKGLTSRVNTQSWDWSHKVADKIREKRAQATNAQELNPNSS